MQWYCLTVYNFVLKLIHVGDFEFVNDSQYVVDEECYFCFKDRGEFTVKPGKHVLGSSFLWPPFKGLGELLAILYF